jgi:exo-1,4-beta-D-glucosaminidase
MNRTAITALLAGALAWTAGVRTNQATQNRQTGTEKTAVRVHAVPATANETAEQRLPLREGWEIQSSAKVQAQGGEISTAAFQPAGWYATSVPSTVLAALVRNRVFPDPYYGMNLRLIPGTDYPIGYNFSHLEMRSSSPFAVSWWYRTEFSLPAADSGKRIWLNFNGINYRANIWLNGQRIAVSQNVAGTFRIYEFDVTAAARPGAKNVLAVEVFPPTAEDLALTWVDWNPAPPDKDMGLWRSVFVTTSGPVAVRYPHVNSQVRLGPEPSASLTVVATLQNRSGQAVSGTLEGTIGTVQFKQLVALEAGETRRVTFTPEKFKQLQFAHPKLWWPWELGKPNLYRLTLTFEVNGAESDRQTMEFGIRQITSKLNSAGALQFFVNREPLLIRGGGWAPDMMLRFDPKRTADELAYVRDLGLNTIRLEGKLIDRNFFEQADRAGLLVMAGWCCCDEWEQWKHWSADDDRIASESLRSQIRRLRNHPSLLVWLNGSDNPPVARVERMYLDILHSLDWPNPVLSSASAHATTVSGPSGVKMTGPYNWVAPAYWYEDLKGGGARGFNTETSPGPAPMPRESLVRMLPAAHLWPIDDFWNFHAGGGMFKTLDVFNQALDVRYGPAQSLDDYLEKSQVMAYEGERAMYEAFARNRYESTGVIQWMLNNAWPGLIWHLWDYYLVPGGGYYGVKKANEPIHIQYSYDDASVVVSNRERRVTGLLHATATVYNPDPSVVYRRQAVVRLGPDAVKKLFAIPQLPKLPTAYFLDLRLKNATGRVVSRNFYWLSKKADSWDSTHTHYYWTRATAYADFTELQGLPRTKLSASATEWREGDERVISVTLRNPSSQLAFFVHLRLRRASDGLDAVPVFWSDNDVSLLPGERRTLTARIPAAQFGSGVQRGVLLDASGWNVPRLEIAVGGR